MRLLSYSVEGRCSVGVEVQGHVVDLPLGFAALPASDRSADMVAPPGDMLSLLETGDPAIAAVRAVARFFGEGRPSGPAVLPMGAVRILAPIARPRKIFCLGYNYHEHATESGTDLPKAPIIFGKWATSIIGPGDTVLLPPARLTSQVDYEAELAFVIGKRGKRILPEQAMEYVVGYTILNDISARDIQRNEQQWLRAKSFDTFAPTGPFLVLRDQVPDPHDLDIKLWLNGQLMQDSNTRYIIFGVTFLVSYLSEVFTLEPGDIVSTGTPSGVGIHRKPPVMLKPGDVMRVEVEGLGSLVNPVAADGAWE